MKSLQKAVRLLMCLLSSICFLSASDALSAPKGFQDGDTYFPYMGRITGKGINVRAAPRTDSDLMYQLEQGMDIVVIAEDGDWCRIKAKDASTAWMHKSVVKDGLVIKDNVNVRARPDLNSSPLGKLNEGDSFVALKEVEDWIEIEMPVGMGYSVSKKFVKYLCPVDEYRDYLDREKKVKELFRQAEDFRTNELRKKYNEVGYDQVILNYQAIIDGYPDSVEAEKSLQRVADAQEKKKISQTRVQSLEANQKIFKEFEAADEERRKMLYEQQFDPISYDNTIALYDRIIKAYPDSRPAKESLKRIAELKDLKAQKMKEWEKTQKFFYKGTLIALNVKGLDKGTHAVVDAKGQTACYAYSDEADLRAFEDRTVEVEGLKYTTVYQADGKIIPVLKITKINLK
jgi:SH3-like domain-containing protein